jgi:hypothetical protein
MAARKSSGIFYIEGVQKLGEQLAIAYEFVKSRMEIMKAGFVWIRPDGRSVTCKTGKALVDALMNYDGRFLREIEQAARPYGRKT